jgi:hypothetical protein
VIRGTVSPRPHKAPIAVYGTKEPDATLVGGLDPALEEHFFDEAQAGIGNKAKRVPQVVDGAVMRLKGSFGRFPAAAKARRSRDGAPGTTIQGNRVKRRRQSATSVSAPLVGAGQGGGSRRPLSLGMNNDASRKSTA